MLLVNQNYTWIFNGGLRGKVRGWVGTLNPRVLQGLSVVSLTLCQEHLDCCK